MTAFFEYPRAAALGRVLPKTKIYEHGQASSKTKQLFVDQVERITWAYKIAPETSNLDATETVKEIQVFRLALRAETLAEDVLRTIDKAIAFPIIFELSYNTKRKAIAAYKRPSESDSGKWVVSEYFESGWSSEDGPRAPLPSALNLEGLYTRILEALLPNSVPNQDPIGVRVERIEAIRGKQREVKRIKARLAREKQFNKRVTINAELRCVVNELERLGGTPPREK